MILLDTQVWIWWTIQDPRLPASLTAVMDESITEGLGVSRFSCWEVAKKVERGKLGLGQDIDAGLDAAEAAPGVGDVGGHQGGPG